MEAYTLELDDGNGGDFRVSPFLLGVSPFKVPIHYQTQSHDPINCYGNSAERTNEITYLVIEFLFSRTTESDRGSGFLGCVCFYLRRLYLYKRCGVIGFSVNYCFASL